MEQARYLSRRALLEKGVSASMLATLAACKPATPLAESPPQALPAAPATATTIRVFSDTERLLLSAVQMQLFPNDGNGPDAQELNALAYLEGAMTDSANIDDGDPAFIKKGCGWLNEMAQSTHHTDFSVLDESQQDAVLKKIAGTSTGENWISLLMYYLAEAITLDPVYGGNTNGIGWTWLEHQPGFPRPVDGKTYRDFE